MTGTPREGKEQTRSDDERHFFSSNYEVQVAQLRVLLRIERMLEEQAEDRDLQRRLDRYKQDGDR